jgi:hypothetical protein
MNRQGMMLLVAAALAVAPAVHAQQPTIATPAQVDAYKKKLAEAMSAASADTSFKAIPLKGEEDQQWFNAQTFKLWTHKLTKDDYIAAGEKRFPGFTHSFAFLAEQFTK